MNYIEEVQTELAKHVKVGKGLIDYYSLLVIILGEETTLADVHDAWAVNINRTWKKENPTLGEHRSVIPFDQLREDVQVKDQRFVDAIHTTAKNLKARGVKW